MKGKILGIISGKGGVGKTTTVANLGVALVNEFGKKILVLDGNIITANLNLHLDLVYPPITLQDALNNDLSLDKITYVHETGLHIIPSSLTFKEKISTNHLWRKVKSLANQYEIILIDSAPGLGEEVLDVMRAVDKLLIITTPDLPSITTSMKSIELAKKMKKPVLGIILNRARNRSYGFSENEIAATMKVPIIAKIPEDEKIPESIATKIPVVLYEPRSPASIVFKELAARLAGRRYRSLSILDRIKLLFSRKRSGRARKGKGSRSKSTSAKKR